MFERKKSEAWVGPGRPFSGGVRTEAENNDPTHGSRLLSAYYIPGVTELAGLASSTSSKPDGTFHTPFTQMRKLRLREMK